MLDNLYLPVLRHNGKWPEQCRITQFELMSLNGSHCRKQFQFMSLNSSIISCRKSKFGEIVHSTSGRFLINNQL